MRMPHVLSKKNEEKNTVQMGAYAVYLWRFGMNKKLRGECLRNHCRQVVSSAMVPPKTGVCASGECGTWLAAVRH